MQICLANGERLLEETNYLDYGKPPASRFFLTMIAQEEFAKAFIRRKPLLTANEAEFFHRLQRAPPGFHVFPQASFAAFLTDDGKLSRNAQWVLRAKFDRKIADFVICDRQPSESWPWSS